MQTYYSGSFHNSLFTTADWRDKEVMVFVPHADDETNLTGATLAQLCTQHIKTRLVYFSNSDNTGENMVRLREALAAARTLGLPDEAVIFLGYCNNNPVAKNDHTHFYNKPEDFCLTSSTGRRETCGLPDHPEFCFTEYGQHHAYTKANLRSDIVAVLKKYQPDIIFAVDFDRHPDHRAFSLLFEEAVAQILRTPGNTYTPEIYKGFAYNGSYLGPKDFYKALNLAGQLPAQGDFRNAPHYDTDWPPYQWPQRLRLPVATSCLSRTLLSNKIYLTLRQHFSQGIIHNAKRVINSDQVFWQRPTTSLSYQAKVTVSSGEGSVLQDFKLADSPDVQAGHASYSGTWQPAADDTRKTVRLTFSHPVHIVRLVLYGNAAPDNNVDGLTLTLSNGWQAELPGVKPLCKATEYVLSALGATPSQQDNITWLELKLTKTTGALAGLNELEVYDTLAVLTAFHFLKILVQDTFAYDYWLKPATGRVDLGLYSYGLSREDMEQVQWEALNKGAFTLHGPQLTLGKGFSYAEIKVGLKNKPEIFDQIILRRKSTWQLACLKVHQLLDMLLHRIEHVGKSNYVKYCKKSG